MIATENVIPARVHLRLCTVARILFRYEISQPYHVKKNHPIQSETGLSVDWNGGSACVNFVDHLHMSSVPSCKQDIKSRRYHVNSPKVALTAVYEINMEIFGKSSEIFGDNPRLRNLGKYGLEEKSHAFDFNKLGRNKCLDIFLINDSFRYSLNPLNSTSFPGSLCGIEVPVNSGR